MSARLGSPVSIPLPAGAVTAAGRVMTFTQAIALASIGAVWVASATIGNRTIQLQIKDAAGNICLRLPLSAAIVASATVNIMAVNGSTFANFAGPPIVQTLPLGIDMPIPANGSITVVDTANVDPADTCSIVALGSY
jgi:hypothetical protein